MILANAASHRFGHEPPSVLRCTGMVVEADELVAKWGIPVDVMGW